MSSSRTASTTAPTIGEIISQYFHNDSPVEHAENLLGCWVAVLATLDHAEGNHLCLCHIQLLSEHFLEFKAMATDHYVKVKDAMD